MPRGPLPQPETRRRNKPTIPTTNLPAGGFEGPIPDVPFGYELGAEGSAWWMWAWRTPQAAGWSEGDVYVIARRASLEDDLAALRRVEVGFDLGDMLDDETGAALKFLIERLKGLASGTLAVSKEARELDDRFGLTPKGLAMLRWKIVEPEAKSGSGKKVGGAGRYGHLSAVDSA